MGYESVHSGSRGALLQHQECLEHSLAYVCASKKVAFLESCFFPRVFAGVTSVVGEVQATAIETVLGKRITDQRHQ